MFNSKYQFINKIYSILGLTLKITKIEINNFKSIDSIEFKINKIGKSYTQMLVGINESGKSNILHAMSLFDSSTESYDYNILHNQKDLENNDIEIIFHLHFESKKSYSTT